jgi:two-component system, cell cycle response regulator CpdR
MVCWRKGWAEKPAATDCGALTKAETAMAKILIAEDETALRSFVARALKLDGHQVEEVGDGAEGIDRLGGDERYDLLLSDIRMPAMDGIELAHQASAMHPTMKILLMTGYAEQRERADNLAAIIVDVVSKPFSLPEIRAAVSRALAA